MTAAVIVNGLNATDVYALNWWILLSRFHLNKSKYFFFKKERGKRTTHARSRGKASRPRNNMHGGSEANSNSQTWQKALPAGREMTKLQRDGSREERGPGQDKG